MHDKALAAFIDRMKAIAGEMVYPDGSQYAGQTIVGGELPSSVFVLPDEADVRLNKLISDELIHKQHWTEKYTEKLIHDKLISILHEAARSRNSEPVEPGVRKLVAEYESCDREYKVIVPMVGVKITTAPIQLGRVLLRGFDDTTYSQLTERCRSIAMANPNYPVEYKTGFFEEVETAFLARLRDGVGSEMVVKAEGDRAKEIALEETRRALELLRYAILFLTKRDQPRTIGILGEANNQLRSCIAIQTDNNSVDYTWNLTSFPFELSDETVGRMKEFGVFDLSDLVVKSGRTEFEEIILRAVHWLSSAQIQTQNEDALLSLITCLETFFGVEKGSPITATITEGVALLTADGAEARKKRKRQLIDLYGKRSRLTHGKCDPVTNVELLELTTIARDLTLLMIRHRDEFASHQQFKDWLENQKLSAAVSFPTRS